MRLTLTILIATAASASQNAMVLATRSTGNTTSLTPFSSSFHQPDPPLIKQEFRAHWNQHKWDGTVSNIATGFLYNSPAASKVRVDEVYDGTLGSSLFDYTNTSTSGEVSNRQWLLGPAVSSKPTCFVDFVNPGFPLITEDFLVVNRAVFAGVEERKGNFFLGAGKVFRWDFLFQGAIPVSVFIDRDNVVQGYDFIGPDTRARAVTRFFNIIVGDIKSEIFEFPC